MKVVVHVDRVVARAVASGVPNCRGLERSIEAALTRSGPNDPNRVLPHGSFHSGACAGAISDAVRGALSPAAAQTRKP